MAPHIQPQTLYHLSKNQVAANLANTCRILQVLAQDTCISYVLSLTRNYLRPIWQSLVPSTVRAELLEETASLLNSQNSDSTGTVIGAAPLYLLALLLAQDVRKLRIELCCYYGCSHQTALLKFLATEGKGLETLELARSTLLRLDRSLLQSVLLSASCLRHLTFRNIASDNILQIIGSHCPNLVSLDVSHSREVTDSGLQQLFFRVELRDKSPKLCYTKQSSKHSKKNVLSKCKNTILNLAKTIRKVCQVDNNNKKSDPANLILILELYERRNKLCSTLKYLNIANTAVSSVGILLAIRQLPELESLGEHCHIGRALELLQQSSNCDDTANRMTTTTYKLKCINTSRTTLHRLQLISAHFPTLYKLKISEPLHAPNLLSLIPKTVVSLHLQSIPSTTQWIDDGIYDYLNGSQGKLLKELTLRFFPGETLPLAAAATTTTTTTLDLGRFLPNCTGLHTLNIDGIQIDWKNYKPDAPAAGRTTNHNSNRTIVRPQLAHLRKIQLGRTLTLDGLYNILKISPMLKIAHIYSCNQLKASDIYGFSEIDSVNDNNDDDLILSSLSTIECFYVYETACMSKEALKMIINKFPKLTGIGNIRNCGLHYTDVQALDRWILQNNLNVELSAGSHWFSSNCFPIT